MRRNTIATRSSGDYCKPSCLECGGAVWRGERKNLSLLFKFSFKGHVRSVDIEWYRSVMLQCCAVLLSPCCHVGKNMLLINSFKLEIAPPLPSKILQCGAMGSISNRYYFLIGNFMLLTTTPFRGWRKKVLNIFLIFSVGRLYRLYGTTAVGLSVTNALLAIRRRMRRRALTIHW